MTPKRIIFHHTADDSMLPQFWIINGSHKKRGFPVSRSGYYVGYHYLVEYNGKIIQCRKDKEIGAHDKDENVGSIGIGLTGNFEYQIPSKEQEKAVAMLTKQIMDEWKIPITQLRPHRDNDNTLCPGKNLYNSWLAENYLHYEKDIFKKTLRTFSLKISKIKWKVDSNTRN